MSLKHRSLLWMSLCALAAHGSEEYTLTMPYKRVSIENHEGSAVFKGMLTYGKPGQPNLPLYAVTFLLPPKTDPEDVSVAIEHPADSLLRGAYYVAPASQPVIDGQQAAAGEYPKDMSVYGESAFFPASWIGKVSFGKMREDQLVEVTMNPSRYNPVTGELRMLTGGALTVSIKDRGGLKANSLPAQAAPVRAESIKKRLKSLIVNPEQLNNAAQSVLSQTKSAAASPAAAGETYVIITTNAIVNASTKLSDFTYYLYAKGYNVLLATESTWGGGTGDAAAEHIRSWLHDYDQAHDVDYVLLIGNANPVNGDVPMKIVYPGQEDPGDETGEAVPTDFYYAELSDTWDKNGNGHYGEYYDDFIAGGADKYAEAKVGRIPYYGVIADLDKVLQKTITYAASASREWRKSVMLPMVPWDGESPMHYLGEQIKNNILIGGGVGYYRLYDEAYEKSLYPDVVNMYPPADIIPCKVNKVVHAWKYNYFGAVIWSSHGVNEDGASDVIHSDSASKLDDTHPSMVFSTSCQNAYPEVDYNIAYALLRNGAITTAAATRNTLYWGSQSDFVKSLSSGGLAYGYAEGIFNGFCSGDALHYAIENGIDGESAGWRNIVIYCIYGSPDITLNYPGGMPAAPTRLQVWSGAQNIFTLAWTDNANNETGYSIESATSVSGPFSPITLAAANVTTMLISANPGDKRFFRVRAVNGAVYSWYSNIDSGTTYYNMAQGKSVTASSQQSGNGASRAVDGNATSTRWAASSGSMPQWFKVDLGSVQPVTQFEFVFERPGTSGDCNDFIIETSSDNSTWTTAVNRSTNTNTSQSQGYAWNGAARYARITISDAPGTYYASMYEFRVIVSAVPAVPEWKSWSHVPDNQIYLEWQPSAGAVTYDVKRTTVSGGPYVTIAENLTGTSLTTKNLIPGTTYYFVVTAVNNAGHSMTSIDFNANSIPTPPAVPGPLKARAYMLHKIMLDWNDNSATETMFCIEQATNPAGPWSQIHATDPNATSYIVPDLSQYTTYYYRIRAYSSSGYSGYSNIATATTPRQWSKYEAEDAALSGGAGANANHTGYSGTGFVDGLYNSVTAQVTFNVNYLDDAGPYEVKLHYSAGNGTSTNTGLYVNGTKLKNITCAATANWDTWADEVETVTLNAGDNTIAYKAESSSDHCINLDYVIVSYNGGSPVIYTITAFAGANGSINPSGGVPVTSGSSQSFAITPYSGYSISNVTVDGASQGAITSYTFTNVTAHHTISATFIGGYGNLAVGKTITASSEIAGGTYSAAKANDDNTATRWSASATTFPQWVKVDLGSLRSISEVEMMFAYPGVSGDCYDFTVETSSDNVNWTTRVSQNPNGNTAQTQRYGFTTSAARYVRITITGAPATYRASLYEFRVFGL
jgi:hypothetical protein